MNKLLITTAILFSAISTVSAQEATITVDTSAAVSAQVPPIALPAMMETGDQKVDAQLRALHKEMEAKMKALRDEYQKKLKAIIGERKMMKASTTRAMASSTKQMRKDTKDARKEVREETRETRKEVREEARETRKEMREEVRGTSTGNPQGNAWGFLRRFFGQPKPAPSVDATLEVETQVAQ